MLVAGPTLASAACALGDVLAAKHCANHLLEV